MFGLSLLGFNVLTCFNKVPSRLGLRLKIIGWFKDPKLFSLSKGSPALQVSWTFWDRDPGGIWKMVVKKLC